MRTRSRALLGLVVGVVVMAGAPVPSSASNTAVAEVAEVAGLPGYQAAAIDWQPCGVPDVRCGSLTVPLDWADPDGPTTHIGLARRLAKDQEKRIGSILMNPGGPGGSGVRTVLEGEVFTESVNERFDVVGFDPRGVNTSEQVRCDTGLRDEYSAALENPTSSQAEFDQLVEVTRRHVDACREATGPLVDHVDTLHTARDMDAIRAALGEEKLTYVGYSYGTLMGQHYAELFPHRIRAMVNDGNMDHSIESGWEYGRKVTAVMEDNFLAFADWCDTTQTCPLYGRDTKRIYADLKRRVRAGTLIDPSTGQPMNFWNLTLRTAHRTYWPAWWREIATTMLALHDGSATKADLRGQELYNDVFLQVRCAEWRLQVENHAEYDALRTKLRRAFPNVEWSSYDYYMVHCVGDPIEVTNPQRELEVDGAPPLVMIGNVHDPATPLTFSRAAARQSGSHLITYEGWGHTAYYPGEQVSPCVNAAVEAYLIHLTVPPRGLRCPPANEPPA